MYLWELKKWLHCDEIYVNEWKRKAAVISGNEIIAFLCNFWHLELSGKFVLM